MINENINLPSNPPSGYLAHLVQSLTGVLRSIAYTLNRTEKKSDANEVMTWLGM